ncbi:hypothetical protein P280DRAFT_231788 [Massarina eburnea CBS 473.64]|uniref:F-box domain-containing protein n=1 Tax=Massarina eburnea CBS 473.64 TaxID=1395130 RepID=A0A6A6RHP2_9PLEO|nr:hypothetical protein P280DRAFT_231788 [Massarina eburnea CBS 473.64]
MSAIRPFSFLSSLPKEIRLMVYDHLPIQIKQTTATHEWSHDTCQLVFLRKGIDRNILETCRTIYLEAKPIAENLVRNESPTIMVDSTSMSKIVAVVIEVLRRRVKRIIERRRDEQSLTWQDCKWNVRAKEVIVVLKGTMEL